MNPFKLNGELLPTASINSIYVDNTLASNLFRPIILIEEIKKNSEILGISSSIIDDEILNVFNGKLNSNNKLIKSFSNELAISFGDRLAKVIVTLKKPSTLSINNRDNWSGEHWDFWRSIKKLYLVGGLTSPILTNIFYKQISKGLDENGIKDFKVSFIEGSSELGTKGLSFLVKDGEYLLFDFGQTYIKRRHHIKDNNDTVIDTVLPAIRSKFLFYKEKNIDEVKDIARSLNNFIISSILETINIVNFKGDNLIIGIANYISDGKIYSARGGYGKLAYITNNYQLYLSKELTKIIKRDINVLLYHDTSAMALNFNNNEPTAVISLGTAFGIGFPE